MGRARIPKDPCESHWDLSLVLVPSDLVYHSGRESPAGSSSPTPLPRPNNRVDIVARDGTGQPVSLGPDTRPQPRPRGRRRRRRSRRLRALDPRHSRCAHPSSLPHEFVRSGASRLSTGAVLYSIYELAHEPQGPSPT
jgi:hypothetical protein